MAILFLAGRQIRPPRNSQKLCSHLRPSDGDNIDNRTGRYPKEDSCRPPTRPSIEHRAPRGSSKENATAGRHCLHDHRLVRSDNLPADVAGLFPAAAEDYEPCASMEIERH